MESMRRRNRWVGLAFAMAGAIFATSAFAGGCGGSESSGSPAPEDTGAADTGIKPDTTPADTSKPDTTPEATPEVSNYDAPGSLFDVVIPDVVFDGDVTAAGCYDCTTTNCHDQIAECDKDERCRGFLLCVLVDCKASTTDVTCLVGCAGAYDVTGLSDPIVVTVQGILSCAQSKCSKECPAVTLDGGPSDGGSETAAVDSASSEASSAEASVGDASPIIHPPTSGKSMSIDPRLADFMCHVQSTFEGMPEVRDGLVDHLKSIDH